MLDALRARLEQLLRDGSAGDARARAADLRDALLEGRAGLGVMRDALDTTAAELEQERRHLNDAERRRGLAAEVRDAETESIAERFAQRHRERIVVLERKLVVQREELALAERQVAEIAAEFHRARSGADREPRTAPGPQAEFDAAAGADEIGARFDERRREETVEAQLAYLKKKLGKE